MLWIAGVAITLFCATGIAAMMGWIPASLGRAPDATGAVAPDKAQAGGGGAAASSARPRAAPVARASAPVAAVAAKCAGCGVVESIREVAVPGEGSGVGAVGGAVVGGILGNQVGGGHGRELATVVGAVGGVVAGNEIEKRVNAAKRYEVTVRLDDGSARMVREATVPAWRIGDHVSIVDGAIRAN